MPRKLALIALLVLYALTGSVAAFADDGHCADRSPTHVTLLPPAGDGAGHGPAEKAHGCAGLCHLLSVAQIHDDGSPLTERSPVAHAVPTARAGDWTTHTVGVPTPPPNVGLHRL